MAVCVVIKNDFAMQCGAGTILSPGGGVGEDEGEKGLP